MATKQQGTPHADAPEKDPGHWGAIIGGHVMLVLGRPGDLQRVDVRPLWDRHYRVNILVGADAASVRVAHSYFLVADGGGNIVTSTPTITKQY